MSTRDQLVLCPRMTLAFRTEEASCWSTSEEHIRLLQESLVPACPSILMRLCQRRAGSWVSGAEEMDTLWESLPERAHGPHKAPFYWGLFFFLFWNLVKCFQVLQAIFRTSKTPFLLEAVVTATSTLVLYEMKAIVICQYQTLSLFSEKRFLLSSLEALFVRSKENFFYSFFLSSVFPPYQSYL